jgi:membrane fusion protein, heavy metal efflux system
MKNLIYISLLALLAACSGNKTQPVSKEVTAEDRVTLTDAQVKNAGIEMGTPQKIRLNTELKVNGMVDVPPQNIISISFPVGGYLKSTQLLPGMHVSKGEMIAIMEDQALVQLQQDYLIAMTKLNYAQKEYERQKLLNENNVNAEKILQLSESDYHQQLALVKGYSEKLQLIGISPSRLNENSISRSVAILSPINGFVSKVNMNIGRYVNPTDVLFELINPDDLHAALTVFEKDIAKIRPGQKVKVSFVDDPEKQYDCEVILVTRNVDENRSALVHCHFETKPQNLLPGMFLNATINISNAEVLSVPEEAVVRYENKEYVFESVGKNQFRMLQVTTGMTDKGFIEAGSSVEGFETKPLVLKNAYAILSKMKNTAEEE